MSYDKNFKVFSILQEVEDAKEVLHGKNQLADQFSSTEIAIIIDDVINRKPRFYQSKYVSVYSIRDRACHLQHQQQETMLLPIKVLTLTETAVIIDVTINVPVVYMVRYKVVLRGDYP